MTINRTETTLAQLAFAGCNIPKNKPSGRNLPDELRFRTAMPQPERDQTFIEAARKNEADYGRALMKRGVTPEAYKTALLTSASRDNAEFGKALLRGDMSQELKAEVFLTAVRNNANRLIESLLLRDIPQKIKDQGLLQVSQDPTGQTFQQLLDAGADPLAVNKQGETAYRIARKRLNIYTPELFDLNQAARKKHGRFWRFKELTAH